MGAFTLIPEKSSFWTAKTQLSLNCVRRSKVGFWFPLLERDSPSSCKITFLNNVSAFDGDNSKRTWPGIGTNGLAEGNPGVHPCGCQIETSIFGEFVWHKVCVLNRVSLGKFDVSRFRNSWMWQVMATEHVYSLEGGNNWIEGLEMGWLDCARTTRDRTQIPSTEDFEGWNIDKRLRERLWCYMCLWTSVIFMRPARLRIDKLTTSGFFSAL